MDSASQVVIIDEAHALIDTILSTHTTELSRTAIENILTCLQVYQKRFAKRLKGSNALPLTQLITVVNRLQSFCQSHGATGTTTIAKPVTASDKVMTAGELVAALAIDQLPLRSIVAWMKESKIGMKVSGYSDRQAVKAASKAQSGGVCNTTEQLLLNNASR